MTSKAPDSAQLVAVFPALVHGEEQLLCDARQLHQLLNVGKVFANWIKDRIAEYDFVAGVDYHIAYGETYRTRLPNQRVHSHTGHGKRAGYGREIGHRAEST